MTADYKPRSPDKVDIAIAAMLKTLRNTRKVSQQELAEAVGVSWQQLQKYETARNRIPASRLYSIALYLDVSILDFYMPLNMPPSLFSNPVWFSE